MQQECQARNQNYADVPVNQNPSGLKIPDVRKQNLIAEETVSKLQELVGKSSTCMFASNLTQLPIHVSPMRVQETDYEGRLWFFSSADSTHNKRIEADPRVQLVFTNTPDMEFLTVFGTFHL